MQSRIAITIGDPCGIGTEIILKSLAMHGLHRVREHFTIFGDRRFLQEAADLLIQQGKACPSLGDLDIVDVAAVSNDMSMPWGKVSRASGAASFAYLDAAIAATLEGKFAAIVTAPIAKSAWKLAGHDYAGQTELLAERSQVQDFGMLFVARSPHSQWVMRTLLATVHIPLGQVVQCLTPELVERKLNLLRRTLQDTFAITTPRIAIAGINPHSGEQGQLGREEIAWLQPLVDRYRQQYPHVQISDPLPPDTMWLPAARAWQHKEQIHLGYDAYLAMYHDQGLIPVKLLAFDRAVNTTIGLPFVRTSPDHGTAFDIAGRGIADPSSMLEAINLAIDLVKLRQQSSLPLRLIEQQ